MASSDGSSLLHSLLSSKASTSHYAEVLDQQTVENCSTSNDACKTGNDPHDEEKVAKAVFHVDRSKISAVSANDQESELQLLGLDVYNQDDFEHGVIDQVDDALAAEEEIRLNKVLEKEMKAIQDDVRSCQEEVTNCEKVIAELSDKSTTNKDVKRKINAVKMQRDNKLRQLKRLQGRQKALIQKTQKSLQALEAQVHGQAEAGHGMDRLIGVGSRTHETEAERMMRMGEMTPFGTVVNSQVQSKPTTSGNMTDFEKYLMDQQNKSASHSTQSKSKSKVKRTRSEMVKQDRNKSKIESSEPASKTLKKAKSTSSLSKEERQNYFDKIDKKVYRPSERDFSNYKSRKASFPQFRHNFNDPGTSRPDYNVEDEYDSDDNRRDVDYQPEFNDEELEEEYDENSADKCEFDLGKIKEKVTGRKKKKQSASSSTRGMGTVRDDGDSDRYFKRIKMWHRLELQKKQERLLQGEDYSDAESDMEFDGGFRVPAKIWKKLYRYQKTGVKWLWELHTQQCGGIIGDEMGLGKTIQMISFLVGLHHSKLRDRGSNKRYTGLGPCVIVCPTTVMHQWVKEFHMWWPLFRVAILHNTGTFNTSEKELIHEVANNGGIIITSYSGVVIHQEVLLRYNWHYVILDEGHKIRNPDAQATLAVKQFRTPHRIILTGSPLQNNLKELWSLFDFVFPGKLGTLPDFMAHFSVPIVQGGYANATQIQVQTAYKCACVLRDTINPYLIRRMKADVKTSLNLPQKNEQVLFCRLTDNQKEIYQEYLDSKECQQILRGNYMIFPGLITLRKICNHPDISTGGPRVFDVNMYDKTEEEMEYGYYMRSGKMIVIEALLKIWKAQNHKVLLFSQGQKMLDILEMFVQKQGYSYLRMDGGTGISARQPLINKFNQTPELFIFLLTTRVGGLGVNLTGADRVVIIDPDWNPSTDTQARERAWRIGQEKQVTIYRLITTGTIEEKIYHRQIFKQFLSNRVLKDPKQRRFFKSNDLFELFMLGSDDREVGTETSAIFAGTGSDVKIKAKVKEEKPRKNRYDALQASHKSDEDPDFDTSGNNEGEVDWDKNKVDRMRELAKKLSLQFSVKPESDQPENETESQKPDNETEADKLENETEKKGSDLGSTSVNSEGMRKMCNQGGSAETDRKEKAGDHRKESDNDDEKRKRKKEKEKRRKKEKERKKREEERRKRKKKKKRKNAVFEGHEVEHLDRSKPYEPLASDEEEESRSSEDYVLRKLFQKSDGLHSAMQHDNIMQSSHPDYAIVEGEADRVAREAARALKRSRQQCYSATSGMPTWTGQSGVSKLRFGQKKNPKLASELPKETKQTPVKKAEPSKPVDTLFAPDPVVKHFDGTVAGNAKLANAASAGISPNVMSSQELLKRMRIRNYHVKPNQQHSDNDESDGEQNTAWRKSISVETNPEFLELITDIRNHVAFGCCIDGQAATDELICHFKERLPPQDSALFKAMLKQICDFTKKEGIGIWRLKQVFR